MASLMVDSCVFIDLLRKGEDVLRVFDGLAEDHDLMTCGVIRCEVLRGIRSPKARDLLKGYLDCFQYVPALNRIWEAVEDTAWALGRKGFHPPLADLIIGISAREAGGEVLTYDRHFAAIPGLKIRWSLGEK